MKNQMLKSFLIVALLIGAMHSTSFASEVTGTLSTGGGTSTTTPNGSTGGQQDTGEPSPSTGSTGTSDDGQVAGSVSEGSSSNSGGSGSGGTSGEVLGEKTMAATPSPAPLPSDSSTSRLSQTNTATPITTGENTAQEELMPEETGYEPLTYQMVPVPETASVIGAISEFSAASWFWIIALTVLLSMVIAYIYNHQKILARTTRMNY